MGVSMEDITVKSGVGLKVEGTWADPSGYTIQTEHGNFRVSLDEAEMIYSALDMVLDRATEAMKRQGVVSLKL